MPFVGSTHYQKIETCWIAYIFQNLPKESVILVKQNRVFEKQFIMEEVEIFSAVVTCKKVDN